MISNVDIFKILNLTPEPWVI